MARARPEVKVSEKKPFDLLRTLGWHRWRILALGLVIFSVLSPGAYFLRQTTYEAAGTLSVSPQLPAFLSNREELPITQYYHDYVRTQVNKVSELQNLMTALNRLPEQMRSIFVPKGVSLLDAASSLRRRLEVRQEVGTQLLTVSLSGSRPDGLAELVNHVINVYMESHREEEEGRDNRRLVYLSHEKKQLEAKIARQQAMVSQLAEKVGTTTFSEEENFYRLQLKEVQQVHLEAETRRLEAENRYQTALEEADALKSLPVDALVEEAKRDHPLFTNTKLWTYTNMREMLGGITGFTEANPDRKEALERIEDFKAHLADVEAELEKEAREFLLAKRERDIQERLIKAKYLLEASRQTERDVYSQVTHVQKQAGVHSQKLSRGRIMVDELDALRDLAERLEQRIYTLKMESKAPGRISLESIARSVQSDKLVQMLVMAFMAAFFAAAGFVVIRERFDPYIRSKDDVLHAVGSLPSWPIPDMRGSETGALQFSKVTVDHPSSEGAMAIRSLAVKLNNERLAQDGKVALLLGNDWNCGVTSIALNLAHAMRHHVDRVLLIDMNRQKPRVEKLVKLQGKGLGLLDALSGKSLSRSVARDAYRDIDVMVMPKEVSATEIDRGKFAACLKELSSLYDFIVLDTAPIKYSDLTEFLVSQADIVALVALGNRCRYEDLYRTVDIMLRLDPKALAPVLNWRDPSRKNPVKKLYQGYPRFLRRYLIGKKLRQFRSERQRRKLWIELGDEATFFARLRLNMTLMREAAIDAFESLFKRKP